MTIRKQSLKEFFKSWTTIRYSVLAILALAVAIPFSVRNFTGDNPVTLLPVLAVVIPIYFVLRDRTVLPLAVGSLMSIVLVAVVPQLQY